MTIDPNSVEVTVATTPATLDDLLWQKQAERARFTGLSTIQLAAERWGNSLLAITGLLATVSAVLGVGNLSMLDSKPAQIVVGVFAALALVCAGVGLILAALAAQGSVTDLIASGTSLRDASLKESQRARRRLRLSRYVSLAVLPLFMIALAVVAYSPRAPASHVLVIDRAGIRLCAESVALMDGRSLILTFGDATSLPVSMSDVASIQSDSQC